MKNALKYLAPALMAAFLVAAGILAFTGSRGPAGKTALSSGKKVEITPADRLRVRTAEDAPGIDIASYSLNVKGLVDRPLSLSFEEVKALPAEERLVALPCVEGWTEKAVWKGPRLSGILGKAGPGKGAKTAVFSSPGGYTTSLTMKDIEETDPLLAYEVNGDALPKEQGFPLRLVVPDRLGYKWIKSVTGIELIEGDYEGYWESRGYDNEAEARGR